MEIHQCDIPPDYLSKLSFEMLIRICMYLPIQSLLRLESLSMHLKKAVGLHLQLVKSLDFTSDKWYGFMPEWINDEALKLLLNRCIELEYIFGLHPNNLLLRKGDGDSKKCISILGIIKALQLCHHLVGVEISDIHLLEAILTELPNIEILGHFHNRNGCFPCNETSQLTLPATSKLTCLHLYGILLPELPALNGLDELHLQFVKFSNPQPFQQFQSQWLLSFMMHNCIGPTNPLHYVPLLTALGNATHLRRLDLVRVPFLGGLLQHVVEDVWRKGGFSGIEKVRISTCKNCFETDIGYLLLASEYWLEEISLQPSLTKDSFFWALKLAKVNFNMFETLELGYVHQSIESAEWTNFKLVEHGLTDYAETPGLISDLGMSLVQVVFNSVISLTIHNCPHLRNPILWCSEQMRWDWLKSLHLDRCHSIQLDKFCQWLTGLPVIHDIQIHHMFRAPPKGCSMVGLSAGTGLGVSSALVAPIGQTDVSPNVTDNREIIFNMNADQTDGDERVNFLLQPDVTNNQSLNEKACQSISHQKGNTPHQPKSNFANKYNSRSSDTGCSSNELNASGSRDFNFNHHKTDAFYWKSNTDGKDSKNFMQTKSDTSCVKESQSLTEKCTEGNNQDVVKQHYTSQTRSPDLKNSSPKSVVSSVLTSSSASASLSAACPASSSSTTLLPLSSTSSSLPSSATASVSSLPAVLPLPLISSNVSSSSVFQSSSLSLVTSSKQKDEEFLGQPSFSPLQKKNRQTQPNKSEIIIENENDIHRCQIPPSMSRQGDASQGSSEQTTGIQNRCPTLEDNFGLTCKAYVQECTYHDHSGQMRIRAVRTQSGKSSVIIPNNDPNSYCVEQESNIKPVKRSLPRSIRLHTGETRKDNSKISVGSKLIQRPPDSMHKCHTCSSGTCKHKMPNGQYNDDKENGSDGACYNLKEVNHKRSNNLNKFKSTDKPIVYINEVQYRKRQLVLDESEKIDSFDSIDATTLTCANHEAPLVQVNDFVVRHREHDQKLPKKRKVLTKNQSTSTSDPVPEDDPDQMMVITSTTLEGLTLDSCGISHLHLMDCPRLATLSGYDLKMLREVKVKNCPSLRHIDFSQVPCLTIAALLETIIWLPATSSRFVKLNTLHMKSKALESWLFAIDHYNYQLIYVIESKSQATTTEGSVYVTNWMDITVWLNNYYLSTLTFGYDEDSKGKIESTAPKNLFVTKCTIGGAKFRLSTDIPWLRTLSSKNNCQIELGKPLPEVYLAERSDIIATLARCCIEPLIHDMAEMRSTKTIIKKCVLCIYIQVSDHK